jgi:hypothetical protein
VLKLLKKQAESNRIRGRGKGRSVGDLGVGPESELQQPINGSHVQINESSRDHISHRRCEFLSPGGYGGVGVAVAQLP